MTSLSMTRGDTTVLDAIVTLDDGPVTIDEDADVRFTAKRSKADPEAVITKSVGDGIVISEGPGELSITIHPADTADFGRREFLWWDLQMSDGVTVQTLAEGTLDVRLDVTTPASS